MKTLREVVGSSAPPLVLFPLPAGQCETVSEALLARSAHNSAAAADDAATAGDAAHPHQPEQPQQQQEQREEASSQHDNQEEAELTVLVPDGSWDCARALVRALVALRASLLSSTDSEGAAANTEAMLSGGPRGGGGPLRFVRLNDRLVRQQRLLGL